MQLYLHVRISIFRSVTHLFILMFIITLEKFHNLFSSKTTELYNKFMA